MTLAEEVQSVLNSKFAKTRNVNDLTESDKKNIESAFFQLEGVRLHVLSTGCTSCYQNGLSKIKVSYLIKKEEIMENKKSQFRLKPNTMIQMHGINDVITKDNCTDRAVLNILKTHPKAIGFFDVFPEDWKEQAAKFDILAGQTKKEAEKESVEPAKEEQVEEVKDNKVKPSDRAQLESKTKAELQEFVGELGYEIEEWESLNKKNLINYILGKG